jgi:catechol 2,3-dioxygenase-like lactoylglutathione lyase family enzyme
LVRKTRTLKFYTDLIGWHLITEPTEFLEDNSPIGELCTDVFGRNWDKFRIAHLSTGDRIGVELFEFKGQVNPEDNFEYWKTGIFHFCVQDPNVEELAEKIVAAGVRSVWTSLVIITQGRNLIA